MISAILCHHKGNFIFDAVESVKKSKEPHEIIVVTSDENLEIEGCRMLYSKEMTAHKRNIGVHIAQGRYIAFFDDDVIVDKDCLTNLKMELSHPYTGMVFGKCLNMENPEILDEAGGFLTWTGFIWARASVGKDLGQFNKTEPIFAGKSANCMIKKSVFWRVGGFDRSFGILGEESDLAWRVWLSGQEVWYVPGAVCLHAFNTRFKPKDFYTHDRVYFNGCRNYLNMLSANLEVFNAFRIVPIHFCVWCIAGLGMILSGKFGAGLGIFKGLMYYLSNFPKLIQKRQHIKFIRNFKDKQLHRIIFKNPSPLYYIKRLLRYWQIGLHG